MIQATNLWGWRNDFFYNQQEHSERHQYRCGKWEFLSFVWWQIKHQHSQKGQTEAWDDEEESVEQGQPLEDEGVGDKRVPVHLVPPASLYSCGIKDLPFSIIKEVLAVHIVIHQDQVHHVSIVSPWAELHGAVLSIEGEEGDIHGAGGLVAGWRGPCYGSVPAHDGFGHQGTLKSTISTEKAETALRTFKAISQVLTCACDSLFIQDDVRQPNRLRRHSDGRNASVVIWVPLQLHINPLLKTTKHVLWSHDAAKQSFFHSSTTDSTSANTSGDTAVCFDHRLFDDHNAEMYLLSKWMQRYRNADKKEILYCYC